MLAPLIGGGLSEPAAKNEPDGQKDRAESMPANEKWVGFILK